MITLIEQEEKLLLLKVYVRLILLWVICESFLGALLNFGPLPLPGILKAAASVFCISLIGYFVRKKGSILFATLVVLTFKTLFNPFIPIASVIAVLIQGILGQVFFSIPKYYRLSCILLGITAITGSAMQGLLARIIRADGDFSIAANTTLLKIFPASASVYYTFWLITGYFIIYVVAGFFVGVLTANAIRQVRRMQRSADRHFITIYKEPAAYRNCFRSSFYRVSSLIIFLILLLFLFLPLFSPSVRYSRNTSILLRALFTFFALSNILLPLLESRTIYHLKKRRIETTDNIRLWLTLLPEIGYIIAESWRLSAREKGFRRICGFWKIAFYNFVQTTTEPVREWA